MTTTLPKPRGVGGRIRTMMQVKDLTVPKAAALCNLTVPSFETYLYDQHLPGAAALMALSDGLGCSADWLLRGTGK